MQLAEEGAREAQGQQHRIQQYSRERRERNRHDSSTHPLGTNQGPGAPQRCQGAGLHDCTLWCL